MDELSLPDEAKQMNPLGTTSEKSMLSKSWNAVANNARGLIRRENILTRKNAITLTIASLCATICTMVYEARTGHEKEVDGANISKLLEDGELIKKISRGSVGFSVELQEGIDPKCVAMVINKNTIIAPARCLEHGTRRINEVMSVFGNQHITGSYTINMIKNNLLVKIKFSDPIFAKYKPLPISKRDPIPGEAHAYMRMNEDVMLIDGMTYEDSFTNLRNTEKGYERVRLIKSSDTLPAHMFRINPKRNNDIREIMSGAIVNKEGEVVGIQVSKSNIGTTRMVVPLTQADIQDEVIDVE